MASRIASLRQMLPEFELALHSFVASPSKFRIVRTVNATTIQPSALYILDSSFNPPSIAHLALVTSALRQHGTSRATPCRLLLLFSTHNADKTPSPAGFGQRIALMSLFAEDLSQHLKTEAALRDSDVVNVSIDVGLIKEPYYNDKSAAIAATTPPPYPSKVEHVHLVGYDTLIRFCNPKYYPTHHPPLSALKPFFDANHRLRVTHRPTDPCDTSSAGYGTLEEQAEYLQGLKEGREAAAGFDAAWAQHINLVGAEGAVGVSSTRARKAAREERWGDLSLLCTQGVAAYIKYQGLYREDAVDKVNHEDAVDKVKREDAVDRIK